MLAIRSYFSNPPKPHLVSYKGEVQYFDEKLADLIVTELQVKEREKKAVGVQLVLPHLQTHVPKDTLSVDTLPVSPPLVRSHSCPDMPRKCGETTRRASICITSTPTPCPASPPPPTPRTCCICLTTKPAGQMFTPPCALLPPVQPAEETTSQLDAVSVSSGSTVIVLLEEEEEEEAISFTPRERSAMSARLSMESELSENITELFEETISPAPTSASTPTPTPTPQATPTPPTDLKSLLAGAMRGLFRPSPPSSDGTAHSPQAIEEESVLEEESDAELSGVEGGHAAVCRECAGMFAEHSINDHKVTVRCPDPACGHDWRLAEVLALQDSAEELIHDPEIFEKLQWVRMQSLLKDQQGVMFCPRPNCGCAMMLDPQQHSSIKCTRCHHKLCLKCPDPHPGMSCRSFHRSADQFREDIEWKHKNSKPCPQCRVPIEKNEGCNHMTCKRCRCQFCWVCLKPYRGHRSASCRPPPDPWAKSLTARFYLVRICPSPKFVGKVLLIVVGSPVIIVAGAGYIVSRGTRRVARRIKRSKVFKAVKRAKKVLRRNKAPEAPAHNSTGACECAPGQRCYRCVTI